MSSNTPSETARQLWLDPVVREKRIAGLQRAWSDPAVKAARIAAQKAGHAARRARLAAEREATQ